MDEEEYDAIFSFLEYGTYPSAWHHKDQKRALRRKCVDYRARGGYYKVGEQISVLDSSMLAIKFGCNLIFLRSYS